jgi:hypothetical protein
MRPVLALGCGALRPLGGGINANARVSLAVAHAGAPTVENYRYRPRIDAGFLIKCSPSTPFLTEGKAK